MSVSKEAVDTLVVLRDLIDTVSDAAERGFIDRNEAKKNVALYVKEIEVTLGGGNG